MNKILKIFRGDDTYYDVTLYDMNDELLDITNYKIYFSVKRNHSDSEYLFQKTSDDVTEIEKTDSVNGEFRIYVKSSDTDDVVIGDEYKYVDYLYDIQIESGNEKHTVSYGIFRISADITR